jgi:hypothetical protein
VVRFIGTGAVAVVAGIVVADGVVVGVPVFAEHAASAAAVMPTPVVRRNDLLLITMSSTLPERATPRTLEDARGAAGVGQAATTR